MRGRFNKLSSRFTDEIIQLSHGDGGLKTGQLINDLLMEYLGNEVLSRLDDSSVIDIDSNKKLAFTTDSFVVDPIFFPGGDIGKLSICGTVNDLAASGAHPAAISLAFILEEGFPVKQLEKILSSIRKTLDETDLKVITGDTKVVGRGNADSIFINTAGIGFIDDNYIIGPEMIKEGDAVVINGTIADHGLAILSKRDEFNFQTDVKSDCAPLSLLVSDIKKASGNIHALRDATRGGLATVLCEMASRTSLDIEIFEEDIPVRSQTRGICEFLGMDPLYIANEGKMVIFTASEDADKVLKAMKKNKYGRESVIIGKVSSKGKGSVFLNTQLGTRRLVDLHYSEQLPRIC
jgi:hydrogenase expression/formation protein HypE